MNPAFWQGRRVFLTGHTGFKGAWLAAWLTQMGAEVTGFAHPPESEPNLWALLALSDVRSVTADINDRAALEQTLTEVQPEAVIHLAAQSLVRRSYRQPVETFATNVLGVVNLLDAVRACESVRGVVIATSDKAYENSHQIWGYRETDPMGGYDPYSGSKGAAEIAAAAMRRSFFHPQAALGHQAGIACVRAGNVIGGGDWAEDRLVPDIVRGCLGSSGAVILRAPHSIRPWQHVLEPLRGYLMVAEKLCSGEPGFDEGWNFGPKREDERAVIDVAEALVQAIGKGRIGIDPAAANVHEAALLTLDATKARARLGWQPVLDFADCIRLTSDWYGGWAAGRNPGQLCAEQIAEYAHRCAKTG